MILPGMERAIRVEMASGLFLATDGGERMPEFVNAL